MARQPWAKNTTATATAAPSTAGDAPDPTPVPDKPELTGAQKAALFVAYDNAMAGKAAVEASVGEAQKAVAVTVKAIVDSLGHGPFNWKGRVLTPIARKDRYSKDGDLVYIMRAPKTPQAVKIG